MNFLIVILHFDIFILHLSVSSGGGEHFMTTRGAYRGQYLVSITPGHRCNRLVMRKR